MFLDYKLLDETTVNTDGSVFLFKPRLELTAYNVCKTIESLIHIQKNEAFIKYHYEIEKMKSKEIQQPKDVEEKQYNEAEIKFHTVL